MKTFSKPATITYQEEGIQKIIKFNSHTQAKNWIHKKLKEAKEDMLDFSYNYIK